jgi:hypothetical protein
MWVAMVSSMVSSMVLAAEPTRCVAKWSGPVAGCPLRGELQASATATSRAAAERGARKEMGKVVRLTVAATVARIPAMTEAEFASCLKTVPEAAFLNCFDEPTLVPEAYCFADLPDPDCWTGEVLPIEEDGWRALDVGRATMCAKVDARLVTLNYTDLALRRAVCQVSCESKTTVRCP